MNLRLALLTIFLCLLIPVESHAAKRDTAANKKIDEAINVHYLGTEFEKAVAILEGTIEACGEQCSNPVLARAYMYIGIVHGAGMQDMAGAREAFATALALDPDVKLDKDLTTDELVDLFEEVGGDASKSATAPGATPDVPPGLSEGDGEMTCTPEVMEVELRRPVPVACRTSKPATKAVLYYRAFGQSSYTQVTLSLSGSDWLGTIPCSATNLQGELKWFVTASGSGGAVDAYGSEGEPNVVQVVQSTDEPAPTHPGKPAPELCADAAECPEEMRGTPSCPDVAPPDSRGDKGWGAGCERHQECEVGLYCLDGSCESPPPCETGEECASGICEDFLCVIPEDSDGGTSSSSEGPENLIGIFFGADLSSISGEYVCNPNPLTIDQAGAEIAAAEPTGFNCFVGDVQYVAHPYSNNVESGAIPSSLAPGTMRVYLSYERIFAGSFGAEVQAGIAFNGSPATGTADLIHAALFGKYWFMGVGDGFKLYGALGGGLGQVDANKEVAVAEFGSTTPGYGPTQLGDPNSTAAVRDFWAPYCPPDASNAPILPCTISGVQAYKSLGQSFVGAGIGARMGFGAFGVDVRLLGKFMLPESGVVLQPTLGGSVGF